MNSQLRYYGCYCRQINGIPLPRVMEPWWGCTFPDDPTYHSISACLQPAILSVWLTVNALGKEGYSAGGGHVPHKTKKIYT